MHERSRFGLADAIRGVAAWAVVLGIVQTMAAAQRPARLPSEGRGALGKRPNVILVMTDDQGYGDLGCHGNELLKTAALDQLYRESIRLTNFHVDPTCSPTRAALLTGRYSVRTGVWHTLMGRSLLRRDERTLGDLFAAAGYCTAVFGKWHLGDNYPHRAVDRGFQVSLVHGGGGIGQTPDYWGNNYFHPVLHFNGKPVKTSGYCTDIFFSSAIKFIEDNRDRLFFVYLPTNVPHSPYQVDPKYSTPYVNQGVPPTLAAFYGMITNFDANMARLLKKLDDLGLAENTILIYLTDNGTSGQGFNVQMRGRKGSAYDGGHRVPCFLRWPAKLEGGFDVPQLTAHIDIAPTLLELCDIPKPGSLKFDGCSLLPLLVRLEDWAPRTVFVQSHRIEHPQPWRQSAVMTEQYRLIDGRELYNVQKDAGQLNDVAGEAPEVVDLLRFQYEQWYQEVSARFGEYCEVVVGSPEQNPTVLSGFDWHGPGAEQVWSQRQIADRPQANGFWAVEVEREGQYRFTLRERPAAARFPLKATAARLKIGETIQTGAIRPGATGAVFQLALQAGKTQLQTWLAEPDGAVRGAYFVEVEYLGPPIRKDEMPRQQEPPRPDRPKPPRSGAYR
ncbi:MAG: arylsulfatase [Pirellulales bacterium]|nr:arylsulfatase [Pirellulales bacterium]